MFACLFSDNKNPVTILSLISYVLIGILVIVFYFYISNYLFDFFTKKESKESSIRAFIFIAPAFIILIIYILYPVVETVRLSFFDKFGRDFVGLNNYIWAINNPESKRAVLNNLGWLLIVPTLSTFFGLVIANLADRIWWGTIAKSIIFMPMAISFVGAGVIWKFVYDYRGPGDQQIGFLNAIIVSLGYEPQAWITIPIWNNVFLMAIMIWIQTGLAMVIFSAALRGVPREMLEAARLDGASEMKIFTSIIIPYLQQTILVIWTIITILVLKIFDIILAMTNGQWQTEVLANLMFDWMFRGGGDSGRGSVFAIVIMIAVIPIMIFNIYRHKQEQKV